MSAEGYLVRRIRRGKYEVSKWGDSNYPISIYTLVETRGGYACNSPGCRRKRICKHAKLIKKWLKLESQSDRMPERMLTVEGEAF